eukprot:GHVU01097895.1.p1 GENE.GHVU01097895.1~~GHVU01097895.1.p1  ORF type:complete len:316 (-),score=46.93 GHVU01097895.1:974-1921(-)
MTSSWLYRDPRVCDGFGDRFWATFWAMDELLRDIHTLQQELQHKAIIFSQQQEAYEKLQHTVLTKACLYKEPSEQETRNRGAEDRVFMVGTVVANPKKLLRNADGLNRQFQQALGQLTEDERLATACTVSHVYASAASLLKHVLAYYASMDMPPLDPKSYRDMDADRFAQLLRRYETRHRHRLAVVDSDPDAYENWVAALKAERADMPQSASVQRRWPVCAGREERMTPPPTMQDLWRGVKDTCPKLFALAGGFSTAYPTTVDVERHFSRMAFLRNKWRNRLRPLALDGCFHSQQLQKVLSLAYSCDPASVAPIA